MTQPPSKSASLPYQTQGGVEIPAADLGVPDHQGKPQAADAPPAVAPPPAEIGTLISADTVGRRGWGTSGAAVFVLVGLAAVAVAVWVLGDQSSRRPTMSPAAVAGVVAVAVGALAAVCVFGLRRQRAVTYVGDAGLASYTADRRGGLRKRQVLLFNDCRELFTGSTRHYTNGAYTGTTYFYRWDGVIDGRGATLLKLSGRYHSKKGTPKAHDPYYFANLAERVWSRVLLDRCQAELDVQRFIQFRVNGADHVRVGFGVMEFCFSGRTERISREEIAKVNLNQGVFHVAAKDAKWFSRAGKFHFNYSKMANARVFLLTLDKLMGYRFS